MSRWGLPDTTGQRTFLVTMVVDTLGSGAFFPFTLLYFSITTDLSLTAIGLGLSVANLLSVPFGPWFGGLTDRHGARPVCLLSNVLRAIGLLAYVAVGSFPALVAASLVVSVGDRAFWGSYGTLVGEVAAPGERQRWFGLLMSLRNLGLGLGGLAGGVLVGIGGTRGPHAMALLDGLSFAVCAVLLTRVRTRREPGRREPAPGAWRAVLADAGYRRLVLANVFLTSGLLVLGFLPVYVVKTLGLPGWLSGTVFTLNCLLIVLLQTSSVAVTERHLRTRMLVVAAGLLASSSALFLLASAVPRAVAVGAVLLGCVVYTFGEIVYSPAADALAAEAAPDELRGRYLAVYQLSWTTSVTAGPLLVGSLLDAGALPLWAVMAALVAVGAAVIRTAEPRLPREALGGRTLAM